MASIREEHFMLSFMQDKRKGKFKKEDKKGEEDKDKRPKVESVGPSMD